MKAFTLIELLAVLVILTIITLITTPIVLNIIEDSKHSSNIIEVDMIVKSANTFYAASMFENIKFDGDTELYNSLALDSNKPEYGSVKINEEGSVTVAVYIDEICYNKFVNSEEVLVEKDITIEQCLNKTSDAINDYVFNEEPINNCYNELCLGTGNVVEDNKIVMEDKVGSQYYLELPLTVNYDIGFTIEYTFKADNLDKNDLNVTYKDIQLLSLRTANNADELILFYKSDSTSQFSFYSTNNGYLSGSAYTVNGLSYKANELNEKIITLTVVYNPYDNTISQYVNGKLNRSVVMQKKKTGSENIIFRNGRYNTNQAGISGEVYSVRIHNYPLSEQTLLNNYEIDKSTY